MTCLAATTFQQHKHYYTIYSHFTNTQITTRLILSFFASCCTSGVHHCFVRASIRKTYGLAPEPYPDCIVAICCPCCAVCQEHNELDRRGATQWNAPDKYADPIQHNGELLTLKIFVAAMMMILTGKCSLQTQHFEACASLLCAALILLLTSDAHPANFLDDDDRCTFPLCLETDHQQDIMLTPLPYDFGPTAQMSSLPLAPYPASAMPMLPAPMSSVPPAMRSLPLATS